MKNIWCKRVSMILVAMLLLLETVVPVSAQNGFMPESEFEQSAQTGMQMLDISEEAIKDAMMSSEEFYRHYDCYKEEIKAADEEMYAQLLGDEVSAQMSVSGNTISENDISGNSISSEDEVLTAQHASYATIEDAAAYLRSKLVARKEMISIKIANTKDSTLKDVKKVIDKAFEYDVNGKPMEGDYLYWHMQAYRWTSELHNNGTMTMRFQFLYRTSAEEEKYVTKRVNQIVKQLQLKSSSVNDYEKVRRIYDYIMGIMAYDTYHYEIDQNYNYMYTTYAALADGYAVCQAYATLFYRLAEEAGISARVICGNDDYAGNPTHGWNIVKIGNEYYNLDATWDDADVPTHAYFLKNMSDFTGHQRNARHNTSAFKKQFPTAAVSYPLPDEDPDQKLIQRNNLTADLLATDRSNYSLSSDGRIKVMLFLDPSDTEVSKILTMFYQMKLGEAGYDVAVIDIYRGYDATAQKNYMTTEEMKRLILQDIMSLTQNPGYYKYSQDTEKALTYRNLYAAMVGKVARQDSLIVVVDAKNSVRYVGESVEGVAQAQKIVQRIKQNTYGQVSKVTAKQTKNNAVKLSWAAYSGAQSYLVYRKTGSGQYYCLGSVSGTTYTDTVSPKKKYTYQVYALSGGVDFAKSQEVAVSTKTMLPKKGKTYTVNDNKYKVLTSTSKSKTVAFKGVAVKNAGLIIIPDTVQIDGISYKVTEISANALKGNNKVKTLAIGSNVTKIGSNAFYGAKKLVNVVVKTKKLKKIGSKALYGISSKAEIKVPSAKYSSYKKLFASKGQKSSVKIKK